MTVKSPKHKVVAAAVVVNDNSEILLLNGPKRGWEIPGGRVEEGEAVSLAVIRETNEETGIDIEIIKFCGVFQDVKNSIFSMLFLAKPIGGEFRLSSESYEIGYFSLEEARDLVNWSSIKRQIELCMNSKEPFIVEFNNLNN